MTAPTAMPRSATALPRVVLAGNPNAGKTTLFNALTGLRAKVANYPGVTVDLAQGHWQLPDGDGVELLDLPGCYSLSALSAEEHVAIQAIAGLPPIPRPAAVIVVVDATELQRHLYLALQIRELGVPGVVAVTMADQLEERGEQIDTDAMANAFGLPVVLVHAKRRRGLAELAAALQSELRGGRPDLARAPFTDPATLRDDIDAIAAAVPADWHHGDRARARAIARWTLMSVEEAEQHGTVPAAVVQVAMERRRTALAQGRDPDLEIAAARYAWIDAQIGGFVRSTKAGGASITDRFDALLLHPVLGFTLFAVVMTALFQLLFLGAEPLSAGIETIVGSLADLARSTLPDGLFRDFVVDAVIEGALSVLVFLPQIVLMFLCLGLLEDSGYMARVVVLTDRLMRMVGLHGRAFVPLLSGFACAVPAVLATRTMERRRDRLLTMLVVPLTTCSARLPVYGLLIAAMVPTGARTSLVQGGLMTAMYLFSTVIALFAAWVFGRTMFRGKPAPLVLQMPPYRRPHLRSVLHLMAQKAGVFVREAGTVILICTIALWFLLTFPRDPKLDRDYAAERARVVAVDRDATTRDSALRLLAAEEEGERRRKSYAGRIGHLMEPVIRPLGFDWQIGIGILGAFAAREVFVSTMGVVYGLGDDVEGDDTRLRDRLRKERRPDGTRVFTPRTCLSLMIFFALACQCMSTLAAVRRESGGWRWPAFLFVYTGMLAWLCSFTVYQVGGWLGFA
ncbi:MAG: ferrous iron transport protein B [Planctomycetota bacterium]